MGKILLVEDDPAIHRLYMRLFGLEGFEARLAEDGQDGLEKLKDFTPDIILLDIMMKTMNGMEMLTILKSDPKTKDIPVVILTNMSDSRVANEAIDKGATLCLVKSEMEPDEVIDWIKSVVAKHNPTGNSPSSQEPATS